MLYMSHVVHSRFEYEDTPHEVGISSTAAAGMTAAADDSANPVALGATTRRDLLTQGLRHSTQWAHMRGNLR